MNWSRIRSIAAVLCMAWTLGGCAMAYMYDGKRYETKEAMFDQQSLDHAEALAAITPLPAPVTNRKLIFAIPSQAVFTDELLRRGRTMQPGFNPAVEETYRNIARVNYLGTYVIYDGLTKKRIYPQVEFVPLDSFNGSIAPSESTDALYFVEPAIGAGQWFYATAKGGRQIFAYDRSPPTVSGKMKNLLDAVQAQAIRE